MPGSAPRATLVNPYGPQVTFRTEDVLPPAALYVSMNDTLLALFSVSLVGTQFALTTRVLMPDGTIQVEAYASVTPINPFVPYVALPPVEGYLLSLAVTRQDVMNCNAFCTVSLYKGSVASPLISLPPNAGAVIAQGEVSELSPLSWPNSPVVTAGTGSGTMRSVALPNPTGNNWTIGASSNQRWSVVSVQFRFNASAAAGNRQVTLVVFDPAGNGLGRFTSGALQAPSVGYGYTFFSGATNALLGTQFVECPIPDGLFLDVGMTLQSQVIGLDAGDSFQFGFMLVREWMGVGHP